MQPLWQQILNSNPMAGKAVVPLWQKILQPKTMQPPAFPSPASIVPLWQKIIGGQQGETFLQTYQRVGAENTAATKAVFDPNAPEELREKGMQRFADMTFGFTGTLQNVAKKGAIKSVQALKGFADDVVKNIDLSQQARKYKSAEEFVDWFVFKKKDPVVNGKSVGKDFSELKPLVSYRKTSDFLGFGEYKFNEGVLKGKIGAGEKLTEGKVNHWIERISKGENPIVIIEDNPYISKITDHLQGGREYDAILESRVRQGHSRLEAYKQLGIKEVPVVYKSQLTDIWKEANK